MSENNFIEIEELTNNFLKYKNELNKLSHEQIEKLKSIITNRHKSNYKYINLQTLEVKNSITNKLEIEDPVNIKDNVIQDVYNENKELTENNIKEEKPRKAIISSNIFDALFIALIIVSVIIIFILIFFMINK